MWEGRVFCTVEQVSAVASEAEILSSQTGFDCGHSGQDIFCEKVEIFCKVEQVSAVASEAEI